MEPGKTWKDSRSGRASGPAPGYRALPFRPRKAREAQPADLSCPPGCALGDTAFALPALDPHDCTHRAHRGAGAASPFPRTRAPPFCRDGYEIWGTLPCPPSTPCLASPPSSLTIAPGSPARIFLLPVSPGQLRRRSRDVGRGLPRAGAELPRAGVEAGRTSRSYPGQNGRGPFASPQKPSSLGGDRRQP